MSKRPAAAPWAVSRAGHLVLSPTKKRSSSPTVAFSLSTLIQTAANLQVRQIQNGVRTFFTSLLSLPFSPIIIVITLCRSAGRNLACFWRSSMLCPRDGGARHWCALIETRAFAQVTTSGGKNKATFPTSTASSSASMSPAHVVSTLFLFSSLTLDSSSKLSSVLVCRSLRRTLSAHGTRMPALLWAHNFPCACDVVSRESCVSLEQCRARPPLSGHGRRGRTW